MAVDIKTLERQIDVDAQLPYAGKLVSGYGNPDGGADIVGRSKEQFGFGYYKKAERFDENGVPGGDSGWIRVEQDNPTNRVMFIDQIENEGFGWKYLGRYGRFFPGKPFDFRVNQFQGLIECGGEHEFPVSQIIELGWHRRAPRYAGLTEYSRPMRGQPVVFPQLADLTFTEVKCVSCGAQMRPEEYQGKEDLMRHEQIFHRQTSSNHEMARTLAGEMGKAVQAIQGGGEAAASPQLLDMMAAMLKQNQELLERLAGPAVEIEGRTLHQHPGPCPTCGPECLLAAQPQSRKGRAAAPSTGAPASADQHGDESQTRLAERE